MRAFYHRLDANMVVKISDFGMCRDVYENNVYVQKDRHNKSVPMKWMAPETLDADVTEFTFAGDVVRWSFDLLHNNRSHCQWAYGVCVWELMTRGETPYGKATWWDMREFLNSGRRLECPKHCPIEM